MNNIDKNMSPCQGHDDEYYMNKLLDVKITELCLSARTQETLKSANVVTLRDLVNVDHRKVHWGKASFSEAYDLLESVNLDFIHSPAENHFIAKQEEINEACAETVKWLELIEKREKAEREYTNHPDSFEDK